VSLALTVLAGAICAKLAILVHLLSWVELTLAIVASDH